MKSVHRIIKKKLRDIELGRTEVIQPANIRNVYNGIVHFCTKDDWQIYVFIDCGAWDYIDKLVLPDKTTFSHLELQKLIGSYRPSEEIAQKCYGVPGHLKTEIHELERIGGFRTMPGGEKAVPVTLQLQSFFIEPRSMRAERLRGEFERILATVSASFVVADLSSLSPSGQTIEALVSLDDYDEAIKQLALHNVRVDPIVSRKLI